MYLKIEGNLKNSGSAFKKAQGPKKSCPHIYILKAFQGGLFICLVGFLPMWTIFDSPT